MSHDELTAVEDCFGQIAIVNESIQRETVRRERVAPIASHPAPIPTVIEPLDTPAPISQSGPASKSRLALDEASARRAFLFCR